MPITYSTELKVKTIRRYEKGESIKALSQELHISQSTLYQWRKEYCSIKTPNHTYTPAEFDAISRRLQKLEELTGSYPGVDKAYAIQAGREVRIMVKPEVVTEDNMILLARDVAKKIESELEYPGQIKVNVIRETKAVEYAK